MLIQDSFDSMAGFGKMDGMIRNWRAGQPFNGREILGKAVKNAVGFDELGRTRKY